MQLKQKAAACFIDKAVSDVCTQPLLLIFIYSKFISTKYFCN